MRNYSLRIFRWISLALVPLSFYWSINDSLYVMMFDDEGLQRRATTLTAKDIFPTSSTDRQEVAIKHHLQQAGALNSATGELFRGDPFRTYSGQRTVTLSEMEPKTAKMDSSSSKSQSSNIDTACSKWSVVTTIFEPSLGVKRTAALDGWCTVIIADTKTPRNYMDQAHFGNISSVHYLSVEDQEEWAKTSPAVAEFVQAIPYGHFARKNLGYLYAVQHGAEFVFDFDDDNILNLKSSGNPSTAVFDPLRHPTLLRNARMPILGPSVFNHHSLMGASLNASWARGFPLEQIQDEATSDIPIAYVRDIPLSKIGVMQYCANSNPDIDAIHRLVKPLPMNFDASAKPVVVPSHAFAPYNAQATLHTLPAMFALFLPFSVPGRVSDIWRGYFAQALFRDLDLSLVFLPPRIVQDRNAHNYLADMKAELDLYFKAGKLIEFLSTWVCDLETVDERMVQLWIELYERGYIEEEDVRVVQLWLRALSDVGYKLPPIVKKRNRNVMLMGQFNYGDIPTDSVVFWAQKWRPILPNIVVRGPFAETSVADLTRRGVHVIPSDADKGFYSPIRNLMETVSIVRNRTDIDGVLYIHDDGLLNISSILEDFHKDSIIGSAWYKNPMSYDDVRKVTNEDWLSQLAYRINREGKVEDLVPGRHFHNDWDWLPSCMQATHNVFNDPAFARYKDSDGAFLVPTWSQADFLYVPTIHAEEFVRAANIVLRHNMFLECGIPMIVQMRKGENVAVVYCKRTSVSCVQVVPTMGKRDRWASSSEDEDENKTKAVVQKTSKKRDKPAAKKACPKHTSHNPLLQGCRSVYDTYERIKHVSEGTYGVVWKAKDLSTQEIVALKQIKFDADPRSQKDGFPVAALREINVLLALSHENIVSVREMVVGNSFDQAYMVMEFYEMDLKDGISKFDGALSQSELKHLMQQMLWGLQYMHDRHYLHRDIKTSNVLVHRSGRVALADLGLARRVRPGQGDLTQLVVTLWYRAPELLFGEAQYGKGVDMWSMGCIFGELINKDAIMQGEGELDQIDHIFSLLGVPDEQNWPGFSNLPNANLFRWKPKTEALLPKKFPIAKPVSGKQAFLDGNGYDLLRRLLLLDPTKRASVNDALHHPYFSSGVAPAVPKFFATSS